MKARIHSRHPVDIQQAYKRAYIRPRCFTTHLPGVSQNYAPLHSNPHCLSRDLKLTHTKKLSLKYLYKTLCFKHNTTTSIA